MPVSSDQAYDRPSSVEVDEENRTVVIKPERSGHGTDESIRQALVPSHTCKWVQRGNFLVCTEGGFEHATAIHPDDRLQGFDASGRPILKRLDIDSL